MLGSYICVLGVVVYMSVRVEYMCAMGVNYVRVYVC